MKHIQSQSVSAAVPVDDPEAHLLRTVLANAVRDIIVWCEEKVLRTPHQEKLLLSRAMNAWIWLHGLLPAQRLSAVEIAEALEIDLRRMLPGLKSRIEHVSRLDVLEAKVERAVSCIKAIDAFFGSDEWSWEVSQQLVSRNRRFASVTEVDGEWVVADAREPKCKD